MKYLRYNAAYCDTNETFDMWFKVNAVIQLNMPPKIRERWMEDGYVGLAECGLEYFGINRIYRDEQQTLTFEFTEQQWTWFVLRWLS